METGSLKSESILPIPNPIIRIDSPYPKSYIKFHGRDLILFSLLNVLNYKGFISSRTNSHHFKI